MKENNNDVMSQVNRISSYAELSELRKMRVWAPYKLVNGRAVPYDLCTGELSFSTDSEGNYLKFEDVAKLGLKKRTNGDFIFDGIGIYTGPNVLSVHLEYGGDKDEEVRRIVEEILSYTEYSYLGGYLTVIFLNEDKSNDARAVRGFEVFRQLYSIFDPELTIMETTGGFVPLGGRLYDNKIRGLRSAAPSWLWRQMHFVKFMLACEKYPMQGM